MASQGVHVPLSDPAREIRLLKLRPCCDFSAPIHGDLDIVPLGQSEGQYNALSYAWGDPLETAPITLNGRPHQVTVNLQSALRHLRRDSDVVVLWVDAVCINQDDYAEKNSQVGQMGRIYRGADTVVVWLGEACDDSDLIVDRMLAEDVADDPLPLPPYDELLRLKQAISAFVGRSWWTRLWVVQEVLLARQVVDWCGHKQLPEADLRVRLERALHLWKSVGNTSSPNSTDMVLKMYGVLPLILRRDTIRAGRGNAVSDSNRHSSDDGNASDQSEHLTLRLLVLDFSYRQVSKPQDKVYGLLGLASDAEAYGVPDYAKPAESVYTEFVCASLTENNGLDLLCFAGLGDAARGNAMSLPSWVADLTSRRYNAMTNYEHLDWRVWGNMEPKFHFAPDSTALCTRGIICDTVSAIEPVPASGEGTWLRATQLIHLG